MLLTNKPKCLISKLSVRANVLININWRRRQCSVYIIVYWAHLWNVYVEILQSNSLLLRCACEEFEIRWMFDDRIRRTIHNFLHETEKEIWRSRFRFVVVVYCRSDFECLELLISEAGRANVLISLQRMRGTSQHSRLWMKFFLPKINAIFPYKLHTVY